MQRLKIGLALGEGGARGLAHIGVLQVLHEQGIKIDFLSGTSMGAVVAAMYAETLDPYLVEQRFKDFVASELFAEMGISGLMKSTQREAKFWDQIAQKVKGTIALNLAQTRQSILRAEKYVLGLKQLVSIAGFEDCQLPLIVVATDLVRGEEVPLCTGDLINALMASSAIPGFFPPVWHEGRLLSDGAICCPVPVKYAACDPTTFVIGVAVPPDLQYDGGLENAIEIMIRAEEINMFYLTKQFMETADFKLMPDTLGYDWNDFLEIDQLILAGRKAAQQSLPFLKDALQNRLGWWKRLLPNHCLSRN